MKRTLLACALSLVPVLASAYSDIRPQGPVQGSNKGWVYWSATSTTDSSGNPVNAPFVAVVGSISAVTNLPATGATMFLSAGSVGTVASNPLFVGFQPGSTVAVNSGEANPLTVQPKATSTWSVDVRTVSAAALMPVAPTPSATWFVVNTHAASLAVKPDPSATWSADIRTVSAAALMPVAPTPSATWFVVNTAANPLTVTPDDSSTWWTVEKSSDLTVTATGAADAAITLSIPSASGLYHYITFIEIIKYVTAAITASATPIIITTTNWDTTEFYMRRVGAVADTETILYTPSSPFKSDAVTTATTIIMPAVTGVKWVAKVHYYTAP